MSDKAPLRIPFFSDDILTLPILGKIKGYYILLAALFFVYLLTKSALIGIIAGVLIFAIVLFEFYAGAKEGGLKNEIKETVFALVFAVLLWFGAGFVLQTPTPINAIVSCSMLPSYERGDMVLLQGGVPNAQIIDMEGEISAINNSAQIIKTNPSTSDSFGFAVNGSLYAYCAGQKSAGSDPICQDFIQNPENYDEYHGPLKISYSKCVRQWPSNGAKVGTICASSAEIGGKTIALGKTNELIVYEPKRTDLFGLVGDIVHRTAFTLRTSDGNLYYFTKGDNNPIFDFQFYDAAHSLGNSPVAQKQSKGRVIARLPYIGNLKMFITPQVLLSSSTESGCDSYFAQNVN